MLWAIGFLVGALPSLALLIFFYLQDRYEREPLRYLAAAFGLGVLSVVPAGASAAGLAELVGKEWLALGGLPARGFEAAILAALPEELCKWLLVYFIVFRWKELDEPIDGVIYCVALALGFATVENVLFVVHELEREGKISGLSVGFWRALFTVPAHALFGAAMGYFFGRAKLGGGQWMGIDVRKVERRQRLWLAFFAPFAFHAAYDLVLLILRGNEVYWVTAILSTLLWIFVLRRVRGAQRDSPYRPS